MLFLIGGASRAGKTMLTKKLAASCNAGWFSVEFLGKALEETAPQMYLQDWQDGIPGGKDFIRCAESRWPFISELIKTIHAAKINYILEGEVLTPQLISTLDVAVTACFLGYDTATPSMKMAEIRAYSTTNAADWTHAYNDRELLCITEERIAFSRVIAEQAREYKMPYFDVSNNFSSTIEHAYEHLYAAFSNSPNAKK